MMFKSMILVMMFMTLLCSCNNEELFVEEPIAEVVNNTENGNTEVTNNENSNEDTNTDNSLPCDFDLTTLSAGDTVVIDCVMDLEGATINLPSDVTLLYEGGEIVNGTLNFSDNTTIDGNLLNMTLTTTGSIPLLKDTVFDFVPERWGIVEGKVSDEDALNNRDIIESMMEKVKDMGVNTFKIDKLDAYFKVDGPLNMGTPELHAINVPSDFNLIMSTNTHLRMQPNGHFRANLLAIYNAKNVTVSGGFLHGDREEHNYDSGFIDSDGSSGDNHEWVNTMAIKGGQNITIDGVTFQDATGDGLHISSKYFYFDSRHIRSKYIYVKNNRFIRARRINLTLVNCEQVFIENNEFIDGGADMPNSKGTAPSCQFNIEPVRHWDNNGELVEYERVNDVYMSNNKGLLTGETGGGFYVSHGNGPIIFENNEIDSSVSYTTAEGVIIRNNLVKDNIKAGNPSNFDRVDFVFGNEVYGNMVFGGIIVGGNGVTIRDNDIEGDIGIYLGAGAKNKSLGVSNCIIKNNTIRASQRGIMAINTTKNTLIEENSIEMLSGSTFALNLYNSWSGEVDANFIVNNNIVTGSKTNDTGAHTSLIGANSISVTNNKLGCVQITGGEDTTFTGNEIDAEINKNGLFFNADCPNSSFKFNTIIIYTSKTPLEISAVDYETGLNLSSTVALENNTVIER
ncbi:right-handed parallel beta-helix repeat-containing protein [Flavobacteriaceae bacterium GSB9]|nr:right-handed parallel beta-helix repeat-containing protein [Flavobacteriaceae bacterium GSB9]